MSVQDYPVHLAPSNRRDSYVQEQEEGRIRRQAL